MAAHRYWRLYCRRNAGNASYTGVTEIEMATSAAGADVTSTSFAIGSGSYQAGTATDAFDDDFTGDVLQWSGTGSGRWVGQDFGAGNEKDIVEVRVRPNKDAADRTFGEFDVQYSDDGSNWTTAWIVSYLSWSVGTTVTFAPPSAVASRYWRVQPTAMRNSGDNNFDCAEMEMAETIAGADECTGGSAISRTAYSGLPASNAFDGSTATTYGTDNAQVGSEYLGYDFGSGVTKDIVEIRLFPRSTFTSRFPKNGIVASSTDGISWLPRWTFTNLASGPGVWSSLIDPANIPASSNHRFWGIRANAIQGTSGSSAGNYFSVAELEYRAYSGGPDTCTGGNGVSIYPFNPSSDTTSPGSKAFDNAYGGSNEYGSAVNQHLTDIIAYDYGAGNEKALPAEIAFRSRVGTYNEFNGSPTDFDLLYSDNGSDWTVQQNFTTTADWTANELRLFTVPGGGVTGRRRQALLGSL